MIELQLAHIYLGDYAKWEKSNHSILFNLYFTIKYCLLHILKNLFYFASRINKPILKTPPIGSIWLMVSSQNTYNTLLYLNHNLNNTYFVTTNTNKYNSNFSDLPSLSFHHTLLYSFRFPIVLYHGIRKHGLIALFNSHRLLEACGMYQSCYKILQTGKPSTIVFSNDHIIKNRGLLFAAKALSIPTIYIQHASVTQSFPPLSFDLNLLEGNDAFQKYKNIGRISGIVKLIGMPKYDKYHAHRKNTSRIINIGVCLHLYDQPSRIQQLCQDLNEINKNWQISIRPHPREKRDIQLLNIFEYSNSKEESIFEFLKRQDVIICGNSSTHLEAILLNIPSIAYNLGSQDKFEDYYGYIRNGLIEQANSPDEISSLIMKYSLTNQEVRHKAKYYNATVGTPHDGNSELLSISLIKEFLKSRTYKPSPLYQN